MSSLSGIPRPHRNRVGFSGTQQGLTDRQRNRLHDRLSALRIPSQRMVFHHGDCIGSDAQAHALALGLGYDIEVHPPDNPAKRAFVPLGEMHGCTVTLHTPLPYLLRNQAIVDTTGTLLACPLRAERSQPYSGTWATIRRAKKAGIIIERIDGSGNLERWCP